MIILRCESCQLIWFIYSLHEILAQAIFSPDSIGNISAPRKIAAKWNNTAFLDLLNAKQLKIHILPYNLLNSEVMEKFRFVFPDKTDDSVRAEEFDGIDIKWAWFVVMQITHLISIPSIITIYIVLESPRLVNARV